MSGGMQTGEAQAVNVDKVEKVDKVEENRENVDTNANLKEGLGVNKGTQYRRFRYNRNFDEKRRQIWEEEQAKKPVLERGVQGYVKWYSVRNHYGFIARNDGGEKDVFVHQTSIAKSRIIKYYLRTLGDGEEVVFDIVQGKQGPEAANVTGPNGAEVRGSRFHNLQFYSFRRFLAFSRDRNRFNLRWGDRRRHIMNGENRRNVGYECEKQMAVDVNRVGERRENDEVRKPNSERKHRFRNFRARRAPDAAKKLDENERNGDAVTGTARTDADKGANVPARGGARRTRRKRRGNRKPAVARNDAQPKAQVTTPVEKENIEEPLDDAQKQNTEASDRK